MSKASIEQVVAPVSTLASKLDLKSGRRTVSTSPIIPNGYFSISCAISDCFLTNSSDFFGLGASRGISPSERESISCETHEDTANNNRRAGINL